MRVIISGPVTKQDIEDADLMAGIVPTSFVTNGRSTPPASKMTTEVIPICMMQPEETRVQARNYSLVQNADALICSGDNPHLVNLAHQYELPVYHITP